MIPFVLVTFMLDSGVILEEELDTGHSQWFKG